MKKKQKTANVAETAAVQTRTSAAKALEKEKLAVKADLEKLMKQYAKLTGFGKLAKRSKKIGKAANDWAAK